jgi:hypothetical protein
MAPQTEPSQPEPTNSAIEGFLIGSAVMKLVWNIFILILFPA